MKKRLLKITPSNPPRAAERFLRFFLRTEDRDQRLGDFSEIFNEIAASEGERTARRWYWGHVLRSSPGLIMNSMYWGVAMIKNYLLIAWRQVKRQKVYALVNTAGLAFGMAAFILMALYVNHEVSFDGFHAQGDRIQRVIRRWEQSQDQAEMIIGGTPAPLVPTMIKEFPEVADGARVGEVDGTFRVEDRTFSAHGLFADEGFFRLFAFVLLRGERATVLKDSYSLVVTRSLAVKLFGKDDPMGKTVSFSQRMNEYRSGSRNARYDLIITGVAADPPGNSHLQFGFLVSLATVPSAFGPPTILENWGRSNYYSYVLLHPGVQPKDLLPRLAAYSPRFRGRDVAKYILQPMKNIHWEPVMDDIPGNARNDRKLMLILSTVAFLILAIAGINAMNLAVARFSKRTKEIGLRKVVGARKSQLVAQFLGESLVFSMISAGAALGLAALALPLFNGLVDRSIRLGPSVSPSVVLIILGMVVFSGLFSGIYPAFFLSSLRTAVTIKGATESRKGGVGLRNTLVVVQFALSVFLLSGMLVVAEQLRFVRVKDVGYNRENVVVMPLRDDLARKNGGLIKAELLRDPRIQAVSGSEFIPLERNDVDNIAYRNAAGGIDSFTAYVANNGKDFFDVFKLRLVQGRNFSPEFPTDEKSAVIVNEAVVRKAGWADPVGKVIGGQGRNLRVIGVVADFNQSSLHDNIDPMMFLLAPDEYAYLSVRIRPGDPRDVLALLKRTIEQYSPNFPFEFYFQDDYFNAKYKDDERFGKAFGAAAALAILIAGLGVFGLVSYATERRTREIAVRKVLGASPGRIARLLSREYVVLAIPACAVAWPAAWVFMTKWLQSFAFRTPIRLWVFGFSGLVVAALALATAGLKSARAARLNPAERLRFE